MEKAELTMIEKNYKLFSLLFRLVEYIYFNSFLATK